MLVDLALVTIGMLAGWLLFDTVRDWVRRVRRGRNSLLSRFLCWIGSHDWRDGPGFPCICCGVHDWLFCDCDACSLRRVKERIGDIN